jgi:hypothetical protein
MEEVLLWAIASLVVSLMSLLFSGYVLFQLFKR